MEREREQAKELMIMKNLFGVVLKKDSRRLSLLRCEEDIKIKLNGR
jgi:hypothetical protein